jgi:hypothetical protein
VAASFISDWAAACATALALELEQLRHDRVVLRERRRDRLLAQRLQRLPPQLVGQERDRRQVLVVLAPRDPLELVADRPQLALAGLDGGVGLGDPLGRAVALRLEGHDAVGLAGGGVERGQLGQGRVGLGPHPLGVLAQAQRQLLQPLVVDARDVVPHEPGDLAVEPAEERPGAVRRRAVAAPPEVGEQRVRLVGPAPSPPAPPRRAWPSRRRARRCARPRGRRPAAPRRRDRREARLGGGLGLVGDGRGPLEGVGARLALRAPLDPPRLERRRAPLERGRRGRPALERGQHLAVGGVEPRDRVPEPAGAVGGATGAPSAAASAPTRSRASSLRSPARRWSIRSSPWLAASRRASTSSVRAFSSAIVVWITPRASRPLITSPPSPVVIAPPVVGTV